MGKFDPTQCKTQLKLAMNRIKLQKNKKDNLSKTGKREVADHLRTGKEGDARVRVENVIKDDFTIETLEIIELFCELLLSRLSSIQASKECPADLKEAICTLLYGAPRLDIPELTVLRDMFAHKFGKQFVLDAMANKEGCVNARVVHKLGMLTPENYLVYQYLGEIAKTFGVNWAPPKQEVVSTPAPVKVSAEPVSLSFPSPPTHTGPVQSTPISSSPFPNVPDVPVPSFNMNDLPGGGGLSFSSSPIPPPSFSSSPIPSFPSTPSNVPSFPSPPSSNQNSGLSFPSPPSSKGDSSFSFPTPPSSTGPTSLDFPSPPSSDEKSSVPDLDELTARFERLKKRDQ